MYKLTLKQNNLDTSLMYKNLGNFVVFISPFEISFVDIYSRDRLKENHLLLKKKLT